MVRVAADPKCIEHQAREAQTPFRESNLFGQMSQVTAQLGREHTGSQGARQESKADRVDKVFQEGYIDGTVYECSHSTRETTFL